jgi:hypothetical protein
MLPTTVMEAVTGEAINLPDAKRVVHLQSGASLIARFTTRTSPNSGGAFEDRSCRHQGSDRFNSSPKSIRSYQRVSLS